jgi:hypothetical protein
MSIAANRNGDKAVINGTRGSVTFEDVAVYFHWEECGLLDEAEIPISPCDAGELGTYTGLLTSFGTIFIGLS